ncbi:MAG: transcriptional repressor [Candidatus Schekmanbacteria bacterium]|nr:MAG: transcriptional repressor [Candidatus Schekmanbacteria bacterium]
MEDFLETFKEYLKSNNLKYTAERETIVQVIFETHDHFDADQLEAILREKNSKISRATIYRTLDLLIKSKLITQHQAGFGRKIYEHILGHRHHDHLVCLSCNSFIEFDDERIENLQNEVCRKKDFLAEHHSLKIFGYCKKCREKKK